MAVDDEDNQSEPSNIASSSARDFRKFPLALVIGVSVGGALLIIILIVLVVMVCRKSRPKGEGSGKMDATEKNMNHISIDVEPVARYGPWGANTAKAPDRAEAAKTAKVALRPGVALKPGAALRPVAAKTAGAAKAGVIANGTGPESGAGASFDPLYEDIISRRNKDPNWDPNLPNNREGGGAHIKKGHVTSAVSMFDNQGFIPDKK